MATKQQMIQKTKDVYTENPDITDWSEVEETLHTDTASSIENFYGIRTSDNNASTNVFTEINANKRYALNTTKQGGKVSVTVKLNNNTGVITAINEDWFTITTSEYLSLLSLNSFTGYSRDTGEPIRFALSSNVLISLDQIGISEVVILNFEYNTQD